MPANSFTSRVCLFLGETRRVRFAIRRVFKPRRRIKFRLGYRGPASLPSFLRSDEPRLRKVRKNDFSALEMHCVKLI